MTTQNLYYYYDEFCLVYSQGKIHDAETYLLIDYRHVISLYYLESARDL